MAVAKVADYHANVQKELAEVIGKGPGKVSGDAVHLQGIQPASFDRAAWDLAIATQSLAYIDSDLALSLSSVYNAQATVTDLTHGVLESMYGVPPIDDIGSLHMFGALLIYYNDMIRMEPKLLQMYDEILPRIDKAIGEK